MNYKIVSDSSANLPSSGCFASVPMKIRTSREYEDDASLDLGVMVEDLKNHKGKSGSSCPNVGEWLDAFGDADCVFAVTISQKLSGSYNAACQAAEQYLEEHPGAKVHVFDSMSAGPEMAMIVDKISALAEEGLPFEEVVSRVDGYRSHAHTLFCLESLNNLARNGRTSMAAAKIAGVLGIRVVGEAVDGQLSLVHKPRGGKKATQVLVGMLQERGFFDGALLRIAHCYAEEAAQSLRLAVQSLFPNARFRIEHTTGLCSFYAEVGGLILGFEGAYNEVNHA